MRQLPWNLIISALLLTGCAKSCSNNRAEMSAEKVVEEYLNIALNMNSIEEKEDLMEYTTGNLAATLGGADNEAIKIAYVDKRYNLKNYSLVERRDRTPRETEVTYELTYSELEEGQKAEEAPVTTTENTVSVIRKKGIWYINDVLGNKTSIEFPVTEMNTIRAKPAQ